jgi:hypothetical protein
MAELHCQTYRRDEMIALVLAAFRPGHCLVQLVQR